MRIYNKTYIALWSIHHFKTECSCYRKSSHENDALILECFFWRSSPWIRALKSSLGRTQICPLRFLTSFLGFSKRLAVESKRAPSNRLVLISTGFLSFHKIILFRQGLGIPCSSSTNLSGINDFFLFSTNTWSNASSSQFQRKRTMLKIVLLLNAEQSSWILVFNAMPFALIKQISFRS